MDGKSGIIFWKSRKEIKNIKDILAKCDGDRRDVRHCKMRRLVVRWETRIYKLYNN